MATAKQRTTKTLIWVVTFRDSHIAKQQELIRYTEESAKRFRDFIQEHGGVAVITEDTEDIPIDDYEDLPIPPRMRTQLNWD